MNSEALDCRRIHNRLMVRNVVKVFLADGTTLRAWTDDLSPGGACLLTEHSIEDERFQAQIFLAGVETQVFECQVVRKGRAVQETFNNLDDIERYVYGVRFLSVSQLAVE
ncbi:MAG: PilZ domain-containing protein [Planctomycetales bacterium]|nr:PilZ domain-containing protein [Planctomycetales bacterium]